MGWRKKLERARRLHRPSLKDWECDGLYEVFPDFVKTVSEAEPYQSFTPCGQSARRAKYNNIPVILDARNTSQQAFAENYEANNVPVVISNIPDGDDDSDKGEKWPAVQKWQLDQLRSDNVLRNFAFKCGEDDDGKSIKVKLKHFIRYLHTNHDDSPLYIFDSAFDEDRDAKKLLSDYRVPSYFRDDLFRFISESRRPPYRWFLVGPERSGTTVHIDPLATSAWNTLISGKKRWVLFPPDVPKHVVKGRCLIHSDEDDEAIHYFMTILPRIKRKAASVGNHGDYKGFECYEFTQNAGETVFIPNGWWHAVLNLTHTVGVTQNFCSPRNFDQVWLKTRTSRKRMAWKFLCQLDKHYPDLAARARAMNKRDAFIMKYDPEEIRRREKEAERRHHEKRKAQKRRHEKKKPSKFHKEKKRISSYQHDNAHHKRCGDTDRSVGSRTSTTRELDREAKRSRLEGSHVSPLVSP